MEPPGQAGVILDIRDAGSNHGVRVAQPARAGKARPFPGATERRCGILAFEGKSPESTEPDRGPERLVAVPSKARSMRSAYPLLHIMLIAAMVVAAVAMASGLPFDAPEDVWRPAPLQPVAIAASGI
jgi:hypothetical protein